MTLSLAAVFIPVLFMGGVVGRLLHEFAVVIGVAVLVSGVVSLTLTPMLCSRFLRPPHGGAQPAVPGLRARLRRDAEDVRRVTLVGAAPPAARPWPSSCSPSCSTAYLFAIIPKGFIPNEDNGTVFAFTEAAQDVSFESMMAHQRAVADVVRPAAVRRAVHVVHRRQRLQHRAEQRPDLHPAQAARGAPAGGGGDRRPAAEACRGAGHPRLSRRSCRRSASAASSPRPSTSTRCRTPISSRALPLGAACSTIGCAQLPGLQDVNTDLQITSPQIVVDIDRDKASAARGDRRPDRERAGRRLRLPAGLDHLHAVQPVLGHPGGRSAVPAGPDRAGAALRALEQRAPGAARRGRHADAGAGTAGGDTTSASSRR